MQREYEKDSNMSSCLKHGPGISEALHHVTQKLHKFNYPQKPSLTRLTRLLAGVYLTLCLSWLIHEVLSQIAVQPQLHSYKRFATFLGQLAPRFGTRQHVTYAPLRQS